MKKFFNKIALVLSILTASVSFTSCDTETLLNFAGLLTQVNGGSETAFVGTAKFQKDYINDKGAWEYNEQTGVATTSNYSVHLTVLGKTAIAEIIGQFTQNGQAGTNSCNLSLGNITVGGVTLSNVQLTSVAYNNGQIGDVKHEGYVYSCSYTMNGKTYTTPTDFSAAPYAYVDGSLTGAANGVDGVLKLNVQIVLDDQNQIEVAYNGTSKQ